MISGDGILWRVSRFDLSILIYTIHSLFRFPWIISSDRSHYLQIPPLRSYASWVNVLQGMEVRQRK